MMCPRRYEHFVLAKERELEWPIYIIILLNKCLKKTPMQYIRDLTINAIKLFTYKNTPMHTDTYALRYWIYF